MFLGVYCNNFVQLVRPWEVWPLDLFVNFLFRRGVGVCDVWLINTFSHGRIWPNTYKNILESQKWFYLAVPTDQFDRYDSPSIRILLITLSFRSRECAPRRHITVRLSNKGHRGLYCSKIAQIPATKYFNPFYTLGELSEKYIPDDSRGDIYGYGRVAIEQAGRKSDSAA